MARPTFSPDDEQARILSELAELADRRKTIETRTNQLIAEATKTAVPIYWIAYHAAMTRKTVYRHLGRAQT